MCGCNGGGSQSSALGFSFLANRIVRKQQVALPSNNALAAAAAIRIRNAALVNARRKKIGLRFQ
jgi:hypothetical protein